MTRMVLSSELKNSIRKDPVLMGKIAEANERQNSTVETWIRNDDPMLTTATNLKLIRTYLGLPEDAELVVDEELEGKNSKEVDKAS